MLLIGGTAQSVFAVESEDIATAERVAASWLALIDAGAYDEGWQQATGDVRNREERNWTQWMRERRGPLGKVLRRTVVYAGPIRFPADEPGGEYLEIKYDTDFFGITHLFEYVRTVRGNNGSWTVCWYFVRKRSPSELTQVDHSHD
jgi:hypothetical protein